jgi:hypothetical protein
MDSNNSAESETLEVVLILYCSAVGPAVAVFLIAFVSSSGSLMWIWSPLLLPSQLLLVPAATVVSVLLLNVAAHNVNV